VRNSLAMSGTQPSAAAATGHDTSGRYWIARLPRAWYIACRSSALRRKPLATTILDTPLVVFRTRNGTAAALLDRCAHRNAPLSLGRVAGERLACRYHGWEFCAEGRCELVPALAGPQQSHGRRVPSFATREQNGFVWVFAAADETPDSEPYHFAHLEDPGYGQFRIDYRVDATLHATLENMLDVPHTAFLHRGLFRGGTPNRITAVVRHSALGVEAQYVGEPPPRGLAARILGMGSDTDATLEHHDRFILPSISQVEYRLGDNHFIATSALTPESDFMTRFSTVVTYRLPVPRLLLRALFEPVARRILAQDRWILSRQTASVRSFGGEQYVSTGVDVLGPEIWRILKRAELGEAAPADLPAEQRIDLMA